MRNFAQKKLLLVSYIIQEKVFLDFSDCGCPYVVNQHLSLVDLWRFPCHLLKALASSEMTKKQGIKFDSD